MTSRRRVEQKLSGFASNLRSSTLTRWRMRSVLGHWSSNDQNFFSFLIPHQLARTRQKWFSFLSPSLFLPATSNENVNGGWEEEEEEEEGGGDSTRSELG